MIMIDYNDFGLPLPTTPTDTAFGKLIPAASSYNSIALFSKSIVLSKNNIIHT